MENLIKNNKDKFMAELPSGHQERFALKLEGRKLAEPQSRRATWSEGLSRRLWLGIPSAAAAILLILILINKQDALQPYIYSENEKVAEMRMIYEAQVDKTIALLENVLENVDDSTRNEINKAIENLTSTTEVFAEIAPLPEEKQLAITSQMYDNQLETLQIIYRKISKGEQ